MNWIVTAKVRLEEKLQIAGNLQLHTETSINITQVHRLQNININILYIRPSFIQKQALLLLG